MTSLNPADMGMSSLSISDMAHQTNSPSAGDVRAEHVVPIYCLAKLTDKQKTTLQATILGSHTDIKVDLIPWPKEADQHNTHTRLFENDPHLFYKNFLTKLAAGGARNDDGGTMDLDNDAHHQSTTAAHTTPASSTPTSQGLAPQSSPVTWFLTATSPKTGRLRVATADAGFLLESKMAAEDLKETTYRVMAAQRQSQLSDQRAAQDGHGIHAYMWNDARLRDALRESLIKSRVATGTVRAENVIDTFVALARGLTGLDTVVDREDMEHLSIVWDQELNQEEFVKAAAAKWQHFDDREQFVEEEDLDWVPEDGSEADQSTSDEAEEDEVDEMDDLSDELANLKADRRGM